MIFPRYLFKYFLPRQKKSSEKDPFCHEIEEILGYSCKDIEIYREAFSLKGISKNTVKNYERLEFLGDSILGSIISGYLFRNYPEANEGFLTQLKSKIVNRKNLNKLGERLNIIKFIQKENYNNLGENITGNLFEAFIGAIYLDLGYETCTKIVLEKLLTAAEITRLENKIASYKGLLLEWSQKKKNSIRYETAEEVQAGKNVVFRCHVLLDNENIANATETSKKKAEEKAAQRAFYILNKKQNILDGSKAFS